MWRSQSGESAKLIDLSQQGEEIAGRVIEVLSPVWPGALEPRQSAADGSQAGYDHFSDFGSVIKDSHACVSGLIPFCNRAGGCRRITSAL
jgi:hypothetical protein